MLSSNLGGSLDDQRELCDLLRDAHLAAGAGGLYLRACPRHARAATDARIRRARTDVEQIAAHDGAVRDGRIGAQQQTLTRGTLLGESPNRREIADRDRADYRPPPWVGPPQGTLPGVVALELVLARTEKVAVYIARRLAYPSGFEFDWMTVAAPGQDELELDPMMFGRHRQRRHGGGQEGLDPELLRIGVQFSDGGRATNIGGVHGDADPPTGPVMQGGGGGGGGGRSHQTQWVWPLPPPAR